MLDVVINEATASALQKALVSTDMAAFLQARDKMAAKLSDGGLQPVIIQDLADVKAFPKKENANTSSSFIDFGALKEQYGIDYLLFLDIPAVGTWRNYYGFVPIGDPKASGTTLRIGAHRIAPAFDLGRLLRHVHGESAEKARIATQCPYVLYA